MSSALCLSSLVRRVGRGRLPSCSTILQQQQQQQQQQRQQQRQQLRHGHQVRVIITRDLPEGQMRGVYAGEVHDVAAGYARNYLVPQKYAVYATPRNFDRCGLVDPAVAAREEAAAASMLEVVVDENDDEVDEDLRAADVLRSYLRNKSVRIIRNVDPNVPVMCHPGHVDSRNLREKLSRQLKIDLEEHEKIHIRNEPVVGLEERGEGELMQLLMEMDGGDKRIPTRMEEGGEEIDADRESQSDAVADVDGGDAKDCDVKVKQIGDYVAKITLRGGYVVPLKFSVVRR
ncbi:hypothetical protein ACHAW5_005760 [Stephanodiscus triporus]|uniref:Ribosomal protein L9 domain-containing protein n=1 Tax=Stephanodiscus triporus TaxID=2934178 RepID=A0ABD3NUH8_9STRA